MNFTWKDTLCITEYMFSINQDEVAKYLGVRASTISRLKSGQTKKPRFTHKDVYDSLFDPTNRKGPAMTIGVEVEKTLLSLLKTAIEKNKLREVMEDLWRDEEEYEDGEYKRFVIQMLKRTRNNYSSKDKNALSNNKQCGITSTIDDLPHVIQQNQTPSEKIITLFKLAIESYCIADFLNLNLHEGIKVDYFSNIHKFKNTIERDISRPQDDEKAMILYGNIKGFVSLLIKYEKYLQDNCHFCEDELLYLPEYKFGFSIMKSNSIEFKYNALDYIYKLDALHRKISSGISLLIPPRDGKDDSRFDKEESIRIETDLFGAYLGAWDKNL